MADKTNGYTASDITALKGLRPVRERPGMYIGSTGLRGLHHLVYEVVDNAVDEALAGFCDAITVRLLPDGAVRVDDNGRGIPVDIHPEEGKPAVEVVMTVLHAGGKFGGSGYAVSGGLHGVGVSVVNALSERLEVEVRRDGGVWRQSFAGGGDPVGTLERVAASDETGTTVTFWADPLIFDTLDYDFGVLSRRMREMAFLNQGLLITIADERGDEEVRKEFRYEGGIRDFVAHQNSSKDPIHESIVFFSDTEVHEGDRVPDSAEVALQWNAGYQDSVFSFANTINTHEGGTHEEGFRAALTSTINAYARAQNLLKKDKDENLTGDDCREGLTAIVSVKLGEPQFEGQTKTKLGNTDMKGFVQRMTNEHLRDWLDQHPAEAKIIVEKGRVAQQGRLAAKKARDLTRRKSVFESGGLPGKLVDCTSRDPAECELFIVEGDSAGGSAQKARDARNQAILPIRGKILNVEKSRLDKILANNEIQAIIAAVGAGIGEDFDLSKTRYHRLVTLADADVDGSHIRTLLLTFFFRYMPEIVEAGYVYAAQPPLFVQRIGKDVHYVHSDRQLEELRSSQGDRKLPPAQRFKGLGEMDHDELWDTTMDPEKRVLRQVTIEDAAIADEIFSTLMGDDVEVRKEFIRSNAGDVRFLDI